MRLLQKLCFVTLMGVFTSSAAQAACTLGDLRGTWFAEGMGGNVAGHCRLVFDASGTLVGGPRGAECSYDEPGSFATVTLRASGKLVLTDSASCGFAGTLSIGGKKTSTSNLLLRMSANKEVLAASGPVIATTMANVSTYEGDAAVVFTAIKQKP